MDRSYRAEEMGALEVSIKRICFLDMRGGEGIRAEALLFSGEFPRQTAT